MSTDRLEIILEKQIVNFSDDFANRVMKKIVNLKSGWFIHPRWMAAGIAASLVFCLAIVYWQDGGMSYDNILGLSHISSENIEEVSKIF